MLSKIYKGSLLNTFLYDNELVLMPFDVSLYLPNAKHAETTKIDGKNVTKNVPLAYRRGKENTVLSSTDVLDDKSENLTMYGYEYVPIDNIYYSYNVNFFKNRELLGKQGLSNLWGLNYNSNNPANNELPNHVRRDLYISMDKYENIVKEIYLKIAPKLNKFTNIDYSVLRNNLRPEEDEDIFFSIGNNMNDVNTPITLKGKGTRSFIDWVTDIQWHTKAGYGEQSLQYVLDENEPLGLIFHKLMYCSVFFLLHQFYFYDIVLINTTTFSKMREYIRAVESAMHDEAKVIFDCLATLSSKSDAIEELVEAGSETDIAWMPDIIKSLVYVREKMSVLTGKKEHDDYYKNSEMKDKARIANWALDVNLISALAELAPERGESLIGLSVDSCIELRSSVNSLSDMFRNRIGLIVLIPLILQSFSAIFYDDYTSICRSGNKSDGKAISMKDKGITIDEATAQESKYSYPKLVKAKITTFSTMALDGNLMRLKIFITNVADDIKLYTGIDDVNEEPAEIREKLNGLSNFLNLYLSENPLFCLDIPEIMMTIEYSKEFLDELYQNAKSMNDEVMMYVIEKVEEKCGVFKDSIRSYIDSSKQRAGIMETYEPNTTYNFESDKHSVYKGTSSINSVNQAEGMCNLLDQIVYDIILIYRRSTYIGPDADLNNNLLEKKFAASAILHDFIGFDIADHNTGDLAGWTEVKIDVDLFKCKHILEYLKSILYLYKLYPDGYKYQYNFVETYPFYLKRVSDNADNVLMAQDCDSRMYSGEKIFNLNLCRMYFNRTLPFFPLNVNSGGNFVPIKYLKKGGNLLEDPLQSVIENINNFFKQRSDPSNKNAISGAEQSIEPDYLQVYDRLYNNLLMFVSEVLEFRDVDKSGNGNNVLDDVLSRDDIKGYYEKIEKYVRNAGDFQIDSLGSEIIPPTIKVVDSVYHTNESLGRFSINGSVILKQDTIDFSKPVVMTEINKPRSEPSKIVYEGITNISVANELTSYYNNSLHGYRIMDIKVDMAPDIMLKSDTTEISNKIPLTAEEYSTPDGRIYSRYFFSNIPHVNGDTVERIDIFSVAQAFINQYGKNINSSVSTWNYFWNSFWSYMGNYFNSVMLSSTVKYSSSFKSNVQKWQDWLCDTINYELKGQPDNASQNAYTRNNILPMFSLKRILRPSRLKLKLHMPVVRAQDIKQVYQSRSSEDYSEYVPSKDIEKMVSRTVDILSKDNGIYDNTVNESYEEVTTKGVKEQDIVQRQDVDSLKAAQF